MEEANKTLTKLNFQPANNIIRHGEPVEFIKNKSPEEYKRITEDLNKKYSHTAIICKIINEVQQNDLKFSANAEKEYDLLHDTLTEIAEISTEILTCCTPQLLQKSAILHGKITQLLDDFETEHISRIKNGECRPQVGLLYLDLLAEFRKISRHLLNITERAGAFYENFNTPLTKNISE